MSKAGLRLLRSWCLLLGLALLVTPAAVWGQITATGSVVGQVTDSNGGAIAGAAITVTDQSTGTAAKAVTDSTGRYIVQNVRLGTYTVTAEKDGFTTAKAIDQAVALGETTTVNFKMQAGAVSQTVEVTSTPGAELQTMNATVGTAFVQSELAALPNFQQDATAIMAQMPTNQGGYVGGAMLDQNVFVLDGGNATDDLDSTNTAYNTVTFASSGNGGGAVVPTPQESIQEVRVATSNQTADFTGASGAQIEMVTKRGTNQYHGAGYEFFTDDLLDADSWGNNHTALAASANHGGLRGVTAGEALNYTPLSKTHYNRYGASFGGPLINKNILGGKTYFFVNYEGYINNSAANEDSTVPTPALISGIIQEPNSAGTENKWSIGAGPGLSGTNCGTNGTSLCDPRNLGVSKAVAAYFNYAPAPTDPTKGDQFNTQGYQGLLISPLRDDTFITRVDHDFNSNWRMYMSYRWYDEVNPSTASGGIDFGGIAPGDTKGVYTGLGNRPIQPAYFVTSVSGTLTPTTTNDFHFNYVRNWWQWQTKGVPDALASMGIPAGITIDDTGSQGASGLGGLDVDDIGWGDARQRTWNGHDWNYRDDVSMLHGNHLLQFGTTFSHEWLRHIRDDDGNSTLEELRYVLGGNSSTFPGVVGTNPQAPPTCTAAQASVATANCIASADVTAFNNLYFSLLGVVAQANELVTRTGSNLQALPAGTPANEIADIEIPDFYVTDAWHVKPSFTLTLGLNYGIAYAPRELTGDKQEQVVDSAGDIVTEASYFATKENDALQGINYDPVLGYEPVGDLGPTTREFQTWYGGISPRMAFTWNPTFNGGWMETLFGHNSSVLRGGFSRDVDREGNTQTVLSGLLGIGYLQSDVCNAPQLVGGQAVCVGGGAGSPATGTTNATNAWRLGNDGDVVPMPAIPQTLSIPIFSGTCSICNAPTSSNGIDTDYDYHPGTANEFTIGIQRQLPHQMLLDISYVDRRGHEVFDTVGLSAAPYMMNYGGQSFEQAYANIETYIAENPGGSAATYEAAIPTQPFFEAALGGANSAYCKSAGGTTCTAGVINKFLTSFTTPNIANIFQTLDTDWVFGPTLLTTQGLGTSSGIYMSGDYAVNSYDAGILQLNKRAAHGLTYTGSLTWNRSFYDGQDNSTNGNSVYTMNPYDQNYSYQPTSNPSLVGNFLASWSLPWGAGEKGLVGRLVGGWQLAPVFTWRSGSPFCASDGSGAFGVAGETDCAVPLAGAAALVSAGTVQPYIARGTNGLPSSSAVGGSANTTSALNWYSNPAAVLADLRNPILGVDGRGYTPLGYGPQSWNMDLGATKDVRISENIGLTLNAQALDVFNHTNPGNPSSSFTSTTSFGDISLSGNRTIELGARLHF